MLSISIQFVMTRYWKLSDTWLQRSAHSSNSVPTSLLWNDQIIQSQEGVQQGNPLGLLLFCLAIHRHCEQLCSLLSVMYLDDVTVGGSVDDVLQDLDVSGLDFEHL